jgi:hypothetical protein
VQVVDRLGAGRLGQDHREGRGGVEQVGRCIYPKSVVICSLFATSLHLTG